MHPLLLCPLLLAPALCCSVPSCAKAAPVAREPGISCLLPRSLQGFYSQSVGQALLEKGVQRSYGPLQNPARVNTNASSTSTAVKVSVVLGSGGRRQQRTKDVGETRAVLQLPGWGAAELRPVCHGAGEAATLSCPWESLQMQPLPWCSIRAHLCRTQNQKSTETCRVWE